MHMHVVLTHNTFQYLHILYITYLDDQASATPLNISLQYRISVLRHPHQMCCKTRDRMPTASLFIHTNKANTDV